MSLGGWKCPELPNLGTINMFERHLTTVATPSADISLISYSGVVIEIHVLYNPWRAVPSLPTVSDKHYKPC